MNLLCLVLGVYAWLAMAFMWWEERRASRWGAIAVPAAESRHWWRRWRAQVVASLGLGVAGWCVWLVAQWTDLFHMLPWIVGAGVLLLAGGLGLLHAVLEAMARALDQHVRKSAPT